MRDASIRLEMETHQRLVKTTPKPNATKKSSGDEFWLLPPPLPFPWLPPPLATVSVELGAETVDDASVPPGIEVVGVDEIADVTELAVVETTSRINIRAPSTNTGSRKAI